MKKTLLSILSIGAFVATTTAQTFVPAAGSPLANGEEGVAYAGQTINAAIPTTADVTGAQIIAALPSQAAAAAAVIDPNTSYPVTVTSTALTVVGLPAGLSADCNGCTVNGGSNRDIVISGTPTEGGNFTIDITSATSGETTIQGFTIPFGGLLDLGFPGLPGIPIPTLPGVLDAEGYTMSVNSNGIEEANAVFSLGFYPNPTEGIATLDVNSTVAGVATIEVYSITGALVQTNATSVRTGANRISLDLTAVPAGIYMIKAVINGHQALIRTQKI